VNTYLTSDLCRPRARARPPGNSYERRAFALTRSGAGVDLPGFGRGRSHMSDHEDDASAARGARGGCAHRIPDHEDDLHLPWSKSDFPADDAAFECCRVKSHEDFPRHIYCLFLVLGIQFPWVLTRCTLVCALVSQAELAIDNTKENAWMALYEHDSDTKLQQAKQLCQLHFRFTYGSPCTVPALLYALRIKNRSFSPPDSLENSIERAYGDLEIQGMYPLLDPLPPSVSNITTKHKEKAYTRSLKYRVSEVCRLAVLQGSPRVMDGHPPEGRMSAFINHTYDDLTRNLFTPAPYLRSFSADSAYYLFRIRTQHQNIIPMQEPRPNRVSQTQYMDRRCPLCPRRQLGSEAHFYLSCPVTSSQADSLIAELRTRFPWDGYTQHQQVAVLLGTMPREPQVQHQAVVHDYSATVSCPSSVTHTHGAERNANIGDLGAPTESLFQCTTVDSRGRSPSAGSVPRGHEP
jgi:hypothetical protein